jgi:hypothetical protein
VCVSVCLIGDLEIRVQHVHEKARWLWLRQGPLPCIRARAHITQCTITFTVH